jgi:AraC-like DNA-binding protein
VWVFATITHCGGSSANSSHHRPRSTPNPRQATNPNANAHAAPTATKPNVASPSYSRLTHLTTNTLGAPPRPWSTWFKLQRAIQHAAAGHTLTDAAHEAGFADSAHLTRTCKRFAGVRPVGLPSRRLP